MTFIFFDMLLTLYLTFNILYVIIVCALLYLYFYSMLDKYHFQLLSFESHSTKFFSLRVQGRHTINKSYNFDEILNVSQAKLTYLLSDADL